MESTILLTSMTQLNLTEQVTTSDFFVHPHHRFVRPLNIGTQLFSTRSYNQEQLPYPSQVFSLLRSLWTGSESLVSLYQLPTPHGRFRLKSNPLQKLSAVTEQLNKRFLFCGDEHCLHKLIHFPLLWRHLLRSRVKKKSGVLPKKKLNEADFQSEIFFSFQINFFILLCDCFRQQLMRRPENFGRQYNSLSANFSSSALEIQSQGWSIFHREKHIFILNIF